MDIRKADLLSGDGEGLYHLLTQVYPEDRSLSLDSVIEFLKVLTGTAYNHHWVAQRGRQIVGRLSISEPWFSASKSTLIAFLEVHPLCRKMGLGQTLLSKAIDAVQGRGFQSISLKVNDGDPDAVRFVTNRGLTPILTLTQSQFELTEDARTHLHGTARRLEGSTGIRFLDGEELAGEYPANWQEKWWRLQQTVSRDIPSPEPWEDKPLDYFVSSFLERGSIQPALWQFAIDDGQLVGLSGLRVSPSLPSVAHVGLTGVVRTHRRRQLARALKSISAARAYKYGVRTIVTENEEQNPMLKLNLDLGFRVTHTESIYRGPLAGISSRPSKRL